MDLKRGKLRLYIFFLILVFISLILVLLLNYRGKEKDVLPEQEHMVLMKYDAEKKCESVIIANLDPFFDESDKVKYQVNVTNSFFIHSIRPIDRFMRFLDKDGYLYYLKESSVHLLLYIVKRNIHAKRISALYCKVPFYYLSAHDHLIFIPANKFRSYFWANKDEMFFDLSYLSFFKPEEMYLTKLVKWNSHPRKPDKSLEYEYECFKVLKICNNLHRPFNPDLNNGMISTCTISNKKLILNYNYYNYMNGYYYVKDFVEIYEKIYSNKEKNPGQKEIRKYGWKTLVARAKDIEIHTSSGNKKNPKRTEIEISSYPMYKVRKSSGIKKERFYTPYKVLKDNSNIYPIPHKFWSPDGKKLLFVGSLEEPGVGNVYVLDINTEKVDIFLERNDKSWCFNPDLEWTKNGILVTCRDAIYFKKVNEKISKLNLPGDLTELRYGKISPSGKHIMFFGKKQGSFYLFCVSSEGDVLASLRMGNGDIDKYQGSWIKKDKPSIIKNEADYYIIPPLRVCETAFRCYLNFGGKKKFLDDHKKIR
ncbi:MAG: hypothetical protein K8T10_20700 [Candidatus Eremiobacteraeota bacterium]|nr:hypothetical protein [Candidatus Eremiobacteraeota bacterium]